MSVAGFEPRQSGAKSHTLTHYVWQPLYSNDTFAAATTASMICQIHELPCSVSLTLSTIPVILNQGLSGTLLPIWP